MSVSLFTEEYVSFQVRCVEDLLFPCEGAKPRANNSGLTLQYKGRVVYARVVVFLIGAKWAHGFLRPSWVFQLKAEEEVQENA